MPGVGERIRQLREARKMSQTELALASGYKAADSLGKVERGYTVPTAQSLEAIADALGTSVSYLVHGEKERAAPQAMPPKPQTEADWIAELGDNVPGMARELAQAAWRLARGSDASFPKPTGLPTLSPPSRSDDAGLVAPAGEREPASGMRSKAGTRKSHAPAKKSVRPATRGRR